MNALTKQIVLLLSLEPMGNQIKAKKATTILENTPIHEHIDRLQTCNCKKGSDWLKSWRKISTIFKL